MMVALKQNQGGWVYGARDVGKTETIRELSLALAKQCLIFNCFAELVSSSVGRILKVSVLIYSLCVCDYFLNNL